MGSLAKLGLTTLSGACGMALISSFFIFTKCTSLCLTLLFNLIYILVVAILFHQNIDLNERDFANNASLLMTNVVPYIWDNTMEPGLLSDKVTNLLNISDFTLDGLSDSIFQNEDPKIYPKLLNIGCSKYYNDDQSCEGTEFYQPSEIRGGIVGVTTKCLLIRGDNCRQCQCIVNNALYNHVVPERITSKVADSKPISTVFATLLESVKIGDINFSQWFEINANVVVGIGFDMYPTLIGFLVGVAMSMIMVVWINSIDHQSSIKKYRDVHQSRSEDETTDRYSLLFQSEGEDQVQSRFQTGVMLVLGAAIIPFIFCAIYINMFHLELVRINNFANIEMGRELEYSLIDMVVGIRDGSNYTSEFTVLYAILLLAAPM
jgi:hypothetical protein